MKTVPPVIIFKSNSEAEIWENLEEVKVWNPNLQMLPWVIDGFTEKTLSYKCYHVAWRERRIHLFANDLHETTDKRNYAENVSQLFLRICP